MQVVQVGACLIALRSRVVKIREYWPPKRLQQGDRMSEPAAVPLHILGLCAVVVKPGAVLPLRAVVGSEVVRDCKLEVSAQPDNDMGGKFEQTRIHSRRGRDHFGRRLDPLKLPLVDNGFVGALAAADFSDASGARDVVWVVDRGVEHRGVGFHGRAVCSRILWAL